MPTSPSFQFSARSMRFVRSSEAFDTFDTALVGIFEEIMATREILIKAFDCKCNECSHSWIVLDKDAEKVCPSCGSNEWNTVWQQSEQVEKNDAPLSAFDKQRLERETLMESRRKSGERKPKRFSATERF